MNTVGKVGAFSIRPATPADAPAIARIHVETWRSAYRGILPDAHLAALSIERRTAGWEKNLRANPGTTLVAETNGAVVGWISFGPCRDDGEAHEAEIYAVYVEAALQRAGVGGVLMTEAEARLAALFPTAARISLWVLERNSVARRFYERRGYAPGTRAKEEVIGGENFVEVRYERTRSRGPS